MSNIGWENWPYRGDHEVYGFARSLRTGSIRNRAGAKRGESQLFFNIRFTSAGEMPAIFQKYHPAGGPASLPMVIRQSAGGFCRPRSQREITMDEHFKCLPNSYWLSPSSSRRARIRRAHAGKGAATNCRGRGIPASRITNCVLYYETHNSAFLQKAGVKPIRSAIRCPTS